MPEPSLPTADRVNGYFKDLNNWGRWGNDDQLGTLNLITPAKLLQAQRLITTGRAVSLARDVIPRPVYMYHVTYPAKRERVDVVLDRFDMVYHGFWITHVDALCHVGWDGELYNGRPFAASLSVEGASGAPSIRSRRAASPRAASSSTWRRRGRRATSRWASRSPRASSTSASGARASAWSRATSWSCAAATRRSGAPIPTGCRASHRTRACTSPASSGSAARTSPPSPGT